MDLDQVILEVDGHALLLQKLLLHAISVSLNRGILLILLFEEAFELVQFALEVVVVLLLLIQLVGHLHDLVIELGLDMLRRRRLLLQLVLLGHEPRPVKDFCVELLVVVLVLVELILEGHHLQIKLAGLGPQLLQFPVLRLRNPVVLRYRGQYYRFRILVFRPCKVTDLRNL